MNWDAFGALAEAAGAVAVFVTLLYLARQIRENTAAQQTTSVWLLNQMANQTHFSLIENPHLAATLCKLERGDEIDEVEQRVVFSLVMSVLNIYVAAWRAHKNNQLSDDDYQSLVRDSEVLKSNGLDSVLEAALRGRDQAFVREFLGDS